MGVLIGALFGLGYTDQLQGFHSDLMRLLPGKRTVFAKSFHNLGADFHRGIQRGHRILKHHGDPVSADGFDLFFVFFQKIIPVKEDLSVFVNRRWLRQKLHNGIGCYALSTTGFAHDGERFPTPDRKRNIANRFHFPEKGLEGNG